MNMERKEGVNNMINFGDSKDPLQKIIILDRPGSEGVDREGYQ